MFEKKSFGNLSNIELYSILKARSDIFVVEQECVYPDLDDKDIHPLTLHMFLQEGCTTEAYARLLAPGLSYESASIGRLLVRPELRGNGLAESLMKCAIEECFEHFNVNKIEIGAQLYLKDFYLGLGFKESSKPYDEDGIMHLDMSYERS